MYVGLKMIKRGDIVVITPQTLISEAEKLMEQNRLWMLLVVDGERLAGYVTKEDALEDLPSRATTLEKHELNYLLSKLRVEKILRTDVPTVTPGTEIEVAAQRMHDEGLHGLAVIDNNNHLRGYINRDVMLEVLVEEMGMAHGGSRIVFEVQDRSGVISDASGIIASLGVSIIAMSTFYHDGKRMVVFRLQTENPEPVALALAEHGFTLAGPENFAGEWR